MTISEEPAVGRRTSVLIAGCDLMTRTRLAGVVSNLGFEVITAADEAEAWTAFTACAPEIAIACWDKPGFDALGLCWRIRHATGPLCFRMVVTARDARIDLTDAIAAGVDDYVWTPIEAPQFRARLIMAEARVRFRRKGAAADEPRRTAPVFSHHSSP